jgi:membrane-bound lytic murein transglycosylase D
MMTPLLERGGLPRDTVYLAMIESGFSPGATSWARAAGPWQFISSTGRRFGSGRTSGWTSGAIR